MMGEGGSGPASQQVGELFAALDRFCQRPKSGRTPEELAVELIELRRACDRLEIEFSETAASFARTGEYDRWGSTTPIDWIRHNTARWRGQLPPTGSGLASN